MLARCPQCQLPLASDERQTGTCPVCEAPLPVQGGAPTEGTKAPTPPTPLFGRAFLLGGVAVVLFLVGGLFGFLLREGTLRAAPDASDAPPAALATDAPSPDDASLKRLKELEAHEDKLGREPESQKRLTAEARAGADAARRDLELARKSKDDRVGELEELAERLKKELAETKAREVATTRDAAQARKAAQNRPRTASTRNRGRSSRS